MRNYAPEWARRAKASLRYLMGRLCAGISEKIARTFAQSVGVFNSFILTSDVGVCVCVRWCVHWGLSLARRQSTTDFDTDGVCGSPLFAPRSTSARIQIYFEFVELGCGMDMCSNYQGEVPVVTGITGWYQVPGSIREQCKLHDNIWLQVPGSPVTYVSYEYMNAYPLWRMAYLWECVHLFGVDDFWCLFAHVCCLQ